MYPGCVPFVPGVTEISCWSNQLNTSTQSTRPSDGSQSEVATPTPNAGNMAFSGDITRLADDNYDGPSIITNIDPGKGKGIKMLMSSTGNDLLGMEDVMGQVLKVTHYVASRATVRNEKSGELEVAVRICLFTENGDGVAFTSWGVVRGLAMLLNCYDNGPWLPGIPLQIDAVRDGKKVSYSLNYMGD